MQRLGAKPGRKAEGGECRLVRGAQAGTAAQGTGAGRSGGRAGDLAKRNEWGFVGPIAGHRINAPIKRALLTVIETSQNSGVSARRSCSPLMIAYVTPAQAHQGLRASSVRRRSEQQQAPRQRRRAENPKVSSPQQQNNRPPALV